MNPTSETTQQRSVSVFTAIAALTLVSVVLLGAWDTIGALKNPDTYQVPSTFQDFREGKTTGTFEKQLDKNMPSRAEIIATANSIRYTILGGTGDQVRNGKDGWLYLTEELSYEATASANLRARADLLGNASKALEAIGVKLVVALIPDKARVAAHHLQSGKYPDYNQERYRDALSELHKRNVTAVDLLPALTEASRVTDTYYRTDTHWNQTGAQIAAKAIANVIQPLRIELGQTAFTSVASKDAISRPGDLIRLMGLEHTPDWLRPTPDVEATIVTTQQSNAVAGGGLFGGTCRYFLFAARQLSWLFATRTGNQSAQYSKRWRWLFAGHDRLFNKRCVSHIQTQSIDLGNSRAICHHGTQRRGQLATKSGAKQIMRDFK